MGSPRQITLTLLVTLSLGLAAGAIPAQQDIAAKLARAESLYYGAEFQASINLLLELEKEVGNDRERIKERLQIELFLGLVYLGLNQTEQAKSKFIEVSNLDPKYTLDPREFSRKVITLFEEAKAARAQNYCVEICTRVNDFVVKGELETAEQQIKTMDSPCSCATVLRVGISQARFELGKQLYSRGQLEEASKEFGAVLALDGTHEMAREYSKLTQERLELAAQQVLTESRTNSVVRPSEAAVPQERIRPANSEQVAQAASQIESEYKSTFSRLVTSWKAACDSKDQATMDAIRREAVTQTSKEAATVTSGLQFGSSALAEMRQCTPTRCIHGDPGLALNRLKSRSNPQIEPSLQRYLNRGIRISIEIDERGLVNVKQITNANSRLAEALKNAVEQWEFYPAVVDGQPKCVETELPITVIQP
jgi:tetratricopeptide (TPR) repeat protein